ncbi:MAG: transglutaminase domain-containing protein [Ferruginibacter sp.]
MKHIKKIVFLLSSFVLFHFYSKAQKEDYLPVDKKVQNLGSLDSFNVAIIADTITRPFAEKEQKARAIYYWISHNIKLDLKASKSNDNKNNDPVIVVKTRKATPLGYAMLFQEMSSMANIRCLIVEGYIKNNTEDINNIPDEVNHAWNVVQLGQSPEQWFYVDAMKASGYADKKMSAFTQQFTSQYFFANKTLFNLDHYPNNSAWLLGPGAKGLKEFYALPVIANAAYIYDLKTINPTIGFIKTNLKKVVQFRYGMGSDSTITSVDMVIGDNKKSQKTEPMNFDVTGGKLVFDFQFKKEDSFPIRIFVNGKDFLQYNVEVIE